MNTLALWVLVLPLPNWLGPIVIWLNQKCSVHPHFEPFDATRHPFDEDVAATFWQTRDALVAHGFTMVADLVFTQRRVRTRVALLEDRAKGDLALAIAVRGRGARGVRPSGRPGAFFSPTPWCGSWSSRSRRGRGGATTSGKYFAPRLWALGSARGGNSPRSSPSDACACVAVRQPSSRSWD